MHESEPMLPTAPLPDDASATTARVRHPRRLLVIFGSIGVAAVVAMGILLVASGRGPTVLDSAWHDLMQERRTDAGITVARWFEVAGGVNSMVIVGVLLTITLLILRRPWAALALAAAMICSEIATGTIKTLVARPRPADSLSDTGLASFPSGHTALAATTACVLALLIGRWFWVIAVPWVIAMAWSRTFLEAHWLTDVLAGAVLGTSIALVVYWAVTRALFTVGARDRDVSRRAIPLSSRSRPGTAGLGGARGAGRAASD
ncbi:phosphatase PAP2 family protein [Microbacterium sp. 22215]|uniref:phosphatase PAP2 family protein n=1 Tax=Microbacterium sp. 22215 TaxID=3453893 RepID=UPI003F82409D